MLRLALALIVSLAAPAAMATPGVVVNTYTAGSPAAPWAGVAVQHFTVPYGCIGSQLEFYCELTGGLGLVDHEVDVQVYTADRKHLGTGAAKVRDLPDGRGWVAVKGLHLKPDAYYAQLFTNSESLRPHIRAVLHSRSDYRGGCAAQGWKGGVPLGPAEDFEARLTYQRPGPPRLDLGTDRRFLVKQGRANSPIVLAEDAPLPEQTAARELRAHVKSISGADLPIILETDYDGGPMIAVGFNKRLPADMQQPAFGALQEQQFIIRGGPGTLLLAGAEPSGPLYAVYEFLHRLGVRWYSPEFAVTPHLADIPVPADTVTYAPPVIGRHIASGIHSDRAWAARNRLTTLAHWGAVGREYGSPGAEGPDMHTAYRLIPDEVIAQHPDWASEVDGQRTKTVNLNTWDLCYTNEDARRYFIQRTIEWAAEHPEAETVWIGQNDSPMACSCANCEAFYAAHGGKCSSVIVQLVNELAAALDAAGLSNRKVKTLAYGWSSEPPTSIAVSDRATIAVCDYRQIAAWRRVARHLDTYLYGNWRDYWEPSPTVYSDLQTLAGASRDGADNLYSSISGFGGSYGSDMVDLRTWTTARMMWDPASDPQALVENFCRGYYGPAAPAVLEALALRHSAFKQTAESADRPARPGLSVAPYVDPDALRRINQTLEAAYQGLPEGAWRRHLEMAWLSTLWTDYWLGVEGLGRYDAATGTWSVPIADGEVRRAYGLLAKQFMIENSVNALGGQDRLDPHELGLEKTGVPWPAARLAEGRVSAVVVPGVGGLVTDWRDDSADFAPLKATWGGMILRYPLFSCTEDNVNGAQIGEYRPTEGDPSHAAMVSEQRDFDVTKTVALSDGRLQIGIAARARQATKLELMTAVMFDLLQEGLGTHPTLSVEQRDGSWKRREMGVETSFWWLEGPLELGDPTGRLMIASQTRPAGVLLTLDPTQLASVDFWYENLMDHWATPEQHGMLRLFLRAKRSADGADATLPAGATRQLSYTMQIVPDASAVDGRAAR